MSITINNNDGTTNPQIFSDGSSSKVFDKVIVTDTALLASTETVTIKLSQTQSNAFGPNFSFYPTVADLGMITDPNRGGKFDPATDTFTESGLVGGSPTFATDLLHRLIYKAPMLPNGQAFVFQAGITVTNGAVTATDSYIASGTTIPVIIADVAPPAIGGTVANQPIASGDKIPPFATLSLNSPHFSYYYDTIVANPPYNTYVNGPSYYYSSINTATITITDGGQATDADGLLTGPGISKTGVGAYKLETLSGANQPYRSFDPVYLLRNLSFQTAAVPAGQTSNPTFAVKVTDTTTNETVSDTGTSLLVIGPTQKPVPPSIAGTLAGQTVAPGDIIIPFAGVTLSDANPTKTDTVTITLTNASGNPTDANGTLALTTGLAETAAGSGVYTLSASSDLVTLTAVIDQLSFTPAPLPSGQTSVKTQFKIDVTNSVTNMTASDLQATVTEILPVGDILIPVPPGPTPTPTPTPSPTPTPTPTPGPTPTPTPTPGPLTFKIVDTTTGATLPDTGTAYSGPVAGLQWQFITANIHNLAITATVPNSFIHTGSGDDAIDVSKVNGTNVLDGSTGSNFLVGGTGFDTFFLDDRNAPADIFSTVVNFHSGDNATVFGVTATDFTLTTSNNQGAVGYKGLDFAFTAAGKANANLVLTGYTTADLTNGKLSVSYGTTAATGGIAGSTFMLVHAN